MPSQSETSAPAASTTPRMFCRKCGYALVGLESRVCPECGRGFDPGNRRTFAVRPPRGWAWRWGRRVLALVLLLVLTAGAGVGWLWWGWHAEQPTIARLRALNQRFSVAPVGPERFPWVLGKRWGYLAERVDSVALENLKATQTESLALGSLSHIESLGLYDCEVSSSTLSHLANLKRLRALCLWNIKIQKPDLAFLEKLPVLTSLGLVGDWTDAGVFEQVGRLKHLKALGLLGARINDSDLPSLYGLSSLETLSFWGFTLSDATLQKVQPLNSLHGIDHTGVRATYPAVAKLKKVIPGLTIDPW